MQSGISASEELQAQFNAVQSSSSTFGLIASIEKEALVPVTTLPSKGSSFEDNLSSLEPHVQPDVPLYLLLRRYDTAPHYVAVTYVPDQAKVRQKMLFASTRLTLVRELGSEHFRESIYTTEKEELTAAGFRKMDAHTNQEAPLTREEQELGAVKRAELEAGGGTASREIHLSKHYSMPMTGEVLAALKEVGQDSGRTVTMLKINPETEQIELIPESPNPGTIAELASVISDAEPRFTFYRFRHTHNGEETSPVLFLYTNPAVPGSKAIKARMLYPLMKRAVLSLAEQEAGLKVDKKFEVEEPSEVTEASVLEELHPRAAVSKGFSRPKRPGR